MQGRREGTWVLQARLVTARPRGMMGLVVHLVELGVASGRGVPALSPPHPMKARGRSQAWPKRRQRPDARWAGTQPHPLAFCLLMGREGATGLASALGGVGRCALQD